MSRASYVLVTAALLSACSASFGGGPSPTPPDETASTAASPETQGEGTADVAAADAPTRTNPQSEPTETDPKGTAVRANPAEKPASYAEGIAALNASDAGTFAAAVALFIEFHPAGSTRASTVRMDLETFLAVLDSTTASADASIRGAKGVMAAACAEAGFDCGAASEADKEELRAVKARGIRVAYAGEGTVRLAVDHAEVAKALDPALDAPSKAFLAATHATAVLSESFDEGGFARDPAVAVDALIGWETLVASPGPYAAVAPAQAAVVRESYLRLCYDGERKAPACNASKALRASYSGFGKAHPDSPSAPVVAAFNRALRRRGWKATGPQLDAIVKKSLAAGPS